MKGEVKLPLDLLDPGVFSECVNRDWLSLGLEESNSDNLSVLCKRRVLENPRSNLKFLFFQFCFKHTFILLAFFGARYKSNVKNIYIYMASV